MTFIERLISFFETLFGGSSPELNAKRELRKIENELRVNPPVLKSGMLQPLFAQALLVLYKQTREIGPVLESTLFSEVASKKQRCLDVIMVAGLPTQMRNQLADLTYEKKKKMAFEDPRSLELQHVIFDKMIQEISVNKNVQQIQILLQNFERLHDICSFNYIPYLKLFDHDFSEGFSEARFSEVLLETAENLLMDIYYLTAGFVLTNSFANVLYMLQVLQDESMATDEAEQDLLLRLRQLASALSKVLNSSTLKNLLCIINKNIQYKPPETKYETAYVDHYCQWMKSAFVAEKSQIEMEIKNERIVEDLRILFEGRELVLLNGYDDETNKLLHQDSRTPFLWVLPMQTLKSFLQYYLTSSQENLLDTVVVEGFFIDPMYQSGFAAALFSCKEVKENLAKFENAFSRGGDAAPSVLSGLINGSKRNLEDGRLLESLVAKYNNEARKIMETSMQQIVSLSRMTGEMLSDFKRSKSEIVSNLKVLFLSARNKEATEFLDRHYPMWIKFIDIMSNYVIIKKTEPSVR